MGRFINSDTYTTTGQGLLGNNMFAYCGNNPTTRFDPSGKIFFTILGTVIGGVTGYIDAIITDTDPVKGIYAGMASGAISGAGVDIGVLLTAITGGLGWGVVAAGLFGAAGGAVGVGVATDWQASGDEYLGATIATGLGNIVSFGLAPINGEIAKDSVKWMTSALVYEGYVNLADNLVTGTIVAVGTTWTIHLGGHNANRSSKPVLMD